MHFLWVLFLFAPYFQLITQRVANWPAGRPLAIPDGKRSLGDNMPPNMDNYFDHGDNTTPNWII